MKNCLFALKTKNKILIIFIVVSYSSVFIDYFYHSFFTRLYYYFKNGNIVDLEYYYIDLPFPKWYILYNTDFGYTVSAKENESIDIAISKSVGQPNDPDIELVSTVLCWNPVSKTFESYNEVKGTKYLYSGFEGKYVMLFLSDDSRFYLIITSYDLTEENEKYLDLLLNSIKKKNNV